MHGLDGPGRRLLPLLVFLSILYLRCPPRVEQPQPRGREVTFNSLFEMLRDYFHTGIRDPDKPTFNSLFEMQVHIHEGGGRREGGNLSILYLRCQVPRHEVRPHVTRLFQFSI